MESTKPAKIVKILCMSDTHGQIHKIDLRQEKGDIFIFGGDFTTHSSEQHIFDFIDYLDKLKFRHKIVISGNHEFNFDRTIDKKTKAKSKYSSKKKTEDLVNLLKKHCIYLEHEMIQIEGIKIFGSPYTFRDGYGAFCYYSTQQAEEIWGNIPKVDILLTHGAPFNIADIGRGDLHYGCPILLQKVIELKPKYHIFGHVHESGGQEIKKDGIIFVNISQCGANRVLSWKPFKFQLEVGFERPQQIKKYDIKKE